jgi:hypothetical protein
LKDLTKLRVLSQICLDIQFDYSHRSPTNYHPDRHQKKSVRTMVFFFTLISNRETSLARRALVVYRMVLCVFVWLYRNNMGISKKQWDPSPLCNTTKPSLKRKVSHMLLLIIAMNSLLCREIKNNNVWLIHLTFSLLRKANNSFSRMGFV